MSEAENNIERRYSARLFTRAPMCCPRCRSVLEEEVARCPRCEFSMKVCEKTFPFAAPPLSLVIDPTRLLPEGIEKNLRKAYRKVRQRAPQVEISFCFVRLQDGVAIEEFAFWLHNSAPSADAKRAWQVLVVGDLTSGRLTLTAGYAIEAFLKAEHWEAALQELAACIADQQWKEGLNGFLIDARVLLTAGWQVAERRRLKSHRMQENGGKPSADSVPKEEENLAASEPVADGPGELSNNPDSRPRPKTKIPHRRERMVRGGEPNRPSERREAAQP